MNHRNHLSRKHWLWLAAVVAIIVLGVMVIRPPAWATPLSGLEQTAIEVQPAPDVQVSAAHVAQVQAADEISSHAPDFQADTPSSDNCIACHTDKKKLKAVAEEPEEVKSEEASGEG